MEGGALATRGLEFSPHPNDPIRGYILLATSFDQTLATTAMLTSVRVVCQNTLHLALSGAGDGATRSIWVYHNLYFDPKKAEDALGLIDPAWERFREQVARLCQYEVKPDEVEPYFQRVIAPGVSPAELGGERKHQIRMLAGAYFPFALRQNLSTARDTAWGLVNAVTYYFDHVRKAKSSAGRRLTPTPEWRSRPGVPSADAGSPSRPSLT